MLMGVKRLRTTAEELVAAGHDPATPVAVIERGFAPDQRTTIGTLATIADRARDARSPAITVIGDVVSLAASATD